MSRQQALLGGRAGEAILPAARRQGGVKAARRDRGALGIAAHPNGRAGAAVRTVDMEGLLGRRLNDIEAKNAPPVVHTAGPLETPLLEPRVSVIGSRQAPGAGLDVARAVSRALSKAGAMVVSGLAAGVDAAAHREAINAGGRTIAVIGTPLDRSYPAANAGLQAEIVRDHLAISQFAAGSQVTRSNFVRRNKTMALLSDATVIASATSGSSGTRHQGWEAIRLGRPLFIHKSVIAGPSAAWAKDMLEYGAVMIDGPGPVIDGLPPKLKAPCMLPEL